MANRAGRAPLEPMDEHETVTLGRSDFCGPWQGGKQELRVLRLFISYNRFDGAPAGWEKRRACCLDRARRTAAGT